MANVKRRYDVTRRRKAAEHTRRQFVDAARALFFERGYNATTIADIAGAAGASPQTFYATFGSKRGVLLALLEAMEAESDAARYEIQLATQQDPRAQLHDLVAFHVELFSRGADIVRIITSANHPDLAAIAREGDRRRYQTVRRCAEIWKRIGALRHDVDEHEAADVLYVFTGHDIHRLFTGERGWSNARFASWLERTLTETLFTAISS